MKLKKLKLVALAMSVAMGTSAIPSMALAEDFTSDASESVESIEFAESDDSFDVGIDFGDGETADYQEAEPAEEIFEIEEDVLTDVGDNKTAEDDPKNKLEKKDVIFFYNLDEDDAKKAAEIKVDFNEIESGSVFYKPSNSDSFIEAPELAKKTAETEASCKKGSSFRLIITIPDFGEYTSQTFTVDDRLEHEWEKQTSLKQISAGNCATDEKGVAIYDYKCKNCGASKYDTGKELSKKDTSELNQSEIEAVDFFKDVDEYGYYDEEVPAKHTPSGEVFTEYKPISNCFIDDNGKITRNNEDREYVYEIVKTQKCEICKSYVEVGRENVIVPAEVAQRYHVEIDRKTSNIQIPSELDYGQDVVIVPLSDDFELYNIDGKADRVDAAKIPLVDCSKPGHYEIVLRGGVRGSDGYYEILDSVTVDVPAHHAPGLITVYSTDKKLKNEENTDLIIVRKDPNGPLTDDNPIEKVFSAYCYKTVKYIEVVACAANPKHTVSTTTKEAPASNNHVINTDIHNEIEWYINTRRTFTSEELVKKTTDVDPDYVKIVPVTATCTQAGTVDLQYTCKLCNKLVDTETQRVTVTTPLGHDLAKPVAENNVDPTCEDKGSFDSVVYCKRCKEEISRKKMEIPALGHVYDKLGTGSTERYDTKNAELRLDGFVVIDSSASLLNYYNANNKKPYSLAELYKTNDYYVVSTVGNGTTVGGGVVRAFAAVPCTRCGKFADVKGIKTLPMGDDGGTPIITVESVDKEGLFCEQGNIVLSVAYKKGNGEDLTIKGEYPYYSSRSAYEGRTAHNPGQKVRENEVAPTETENGSYDEVIYCTVCGKEISRKTFVVDPAGKHVHTIEKVEAKEATCEEDGNTEYYQCTACEKLFSDAAGETEITAESVVVKAKGHTPGEEVKENVTATSYDKVVYCTVCEKEISRETVNFTAPGKVKGIKTTANEGKQKIRVEFGAVSGAEVYRVYWKAHGETAYQKHDTTNLSYTISGLTPNTLYDIRVRAGKTVDGVKVWGKTSGVYRRWLKTVATSYTKTADSITVNITPVSGAIKYQIHISEYKDMTDESVKTVKSTTTAYTIKGLEAGTKYFIRVRPIISADGKNYSGALNSVKGVTTKKK